MRRTRSYQLSRLLAFLLVLFHQFIIFFSSLPPFPSLDGETAQDQHQISSRNNIFALAFFLSSSRRNFFGSQKVFGGFGSWGFGKTSTVLTMSFLIRLLNTEKVRRRKKTRSGKKEEMFMTLMRRGKGGEKATRTQGLLDDRYMQ